ncbi:MAG: glycosyltransferase family 2 protein [Oscillospiraceae bacterium]|nr:glycosyltransferase family 2 protein [Oscillospiraceae bacterium]
MNELEFTVLMPCLNEEMTVAFCIEEAKRFISDNNLSAEILIADNGSSDDSAKIAKMHGARVVYVPDKGYGSALIGGIKAARGRFIIMGDCDMSYDFYHLEGFTQKLREGYSLVMGDRFAGGIEKGAMPFFHRYFGIPLLSLLGRLRFNTDVRDFHCGIRAFDRRAALSLGLNCCGMEFATEIIAKFALSGAKIAQIPVVLRKDGRNGRSHLRSIPDGLRHLKFIVFFKK